MDAKQTKQLEKLKADETRILKEKQELENILAQENLEKSRKATHRKNLEGQQRTRQQMYRTLSPLHVRLILFHYTVSKGLLSDADIEKLIDNMRLRTYFNDLDKKYESDIEKPLKFSETNDLVSD
jgi:mRNA-degrading endonuclease RelE of RelBE toxin-antitoxin system